VVHQTVSGAPAGSASTRRSREKRKATWLKFTGLSGGAPDCPVVHQTVRGANSARANGRQRNQRATRGLSQRLVGASDCLVCTGQCPVSHEDCCSNGQLSSIWKEIAHRTSYKTCPVVHRTVRCATQQKARIAFQKEFQRLLGPLGL
jgi:hypothetical protein